MGTIDTVLHGRWDELEVQHKTGPESANSSGESQGEYEYYRRKFVKLGQAKQSVVSVYEIPLGKAAYPYHYHLKNEETFFIVSGRGLLRTPEGEREVAAGDLLFFPAEPGGAHKLTNIGGEPLIYVDFDTQNDLDAAVYPDSGKIGLWGRGVNQVFMEKDAVDYYKGE